MPASALRLAIRIVIYSIIAGLVLTSFKLLTPVFITDGLDPSWRAALLQARLLGLGFGNDVVFTGGPLSHVYSETFSGELYHETMLARLMFAAFYTVFLINAAHRSKSLFAAALGAFPFLFSLPDPMFLGLPFCASLLGTLPVQRTGVRLLIAAGAAVSAVATLAKFSVFPVAIAGFVIVDLIALSRRRLPIALAAYGLTLVVLFLIISPNGSVLEYFRGSLETTAGYSEAMSLSGPVRELILFFVIAFMLLGAIALSEFRSGESPLLIAAGRVTLVAVFLVVSLKSGFVRHDGHSLFAWAALGLATGTYAAFSWRKFSPRTCAAFVGLTLLVAVSFVNRLVSLTGAPVHLLVSGMIAERQAEYRHWMDFISSPGSWFAKQRAAEKASYDEIRAQHPWPQLTGTVDTVPDVQAALIANGLRYHPRPTIQEYTTYNRALIDRNSSFFRGDRAPDFLLMAPGSIDNRHPAFAEGPIWPELLARYVPYDMVEGMALLRKRDKPLDPGMHALRSQSGTIDRPLDLTPLPDRAIFARIDVQPTLLGRLAGLVFKPAMLAMDVEYTDGTTGSYRFIPSIAREGFFLSPFIATGAAYVSLAMGEAGVNPQKIKSIAIRPGVLAKWLWSGTFTVELQTIEEDRLRAEMGATAPNPAMRQILELFSVMMQNPDAHLSLVEQGILAHAPTSLNLPTAGNRPLRLGFGLVSGAWQGEGHTDGVCFRATMATSATPLWERCLDPAAVPADRGAQEAVIAVPEGARSVVLETTCRTNCSWDWSYWSKISVE